jgi:hypothetical protein
MPQETTPRDRYTSKVMLWGVIGLDFSLTVILTETVNSEFRLLDEDHIFMQDGARPHTSKATMAVLEGVNVSVVD